MSQKENEEEEERMTMLMKIMMTPETVAARTTLMFRQSYMVTWGAHFGGMPLSCHLFPLNNT